MASVLPISTQDAIRRIRRVQTITIAWMGGEAVVSLVAAWRAHSPALLAFGGDSAIELLSAVVVLWRFRANTSRENIERRAARIAGFLLFVLAVFVVAAAGMALLGYSEPKPTLLGITVLIAAAAVMPWLAKEKRRLSASTGSAALRADAAESALCAYLSVIALAGLAVNAIWRATWADPVAALVILPLVIWEGREALLRQALRLLLTTESQAGPRSPIILLSATHCDRITDKVYLRRLAVMEATSNASQHRV